MKKSNIVWAIALIVLAVAVILNTVGVDFGLKNISAWKLVASGLLLAFAIERCLEGEFSLLFIPLVIIFLILEKEIALACGIPSGDIGPNWLFILSAVLLTIGVSMLLPNKGIKIHINANGKNGRIKKDNVVRDGNTPENEEITAKEPALDVDDDSDDSDCDCDFDSDQDNEDDSDDSDCDFDLNEKAFDKSFKEAFKKGENAYYNRLSSTTKYVDCSKHREISCYNKLGSTEVYFTNTDNFKGTAKLMVVNKMGNVEIFVPRDWVVSLDVVNNLGNVDCEKSPKANPNKRLVITGYNKFGNIEVTYTK
ncbi:MAG: hypothetical protein IKC33_06160 [Clostridia bacterium]|nr:hypothetical protein [Clostridia bacterium]